MILNPELSQWLEEMQYYLYGAVALVFIVAVLAVSGFFPWFTRKVVRGGQLTIEERLRELENSNSSKQDNATEDEDDNEE